MGFAGLVAKALPFVGKAIGWAAPTAVEVWNAWQQKEQQDWQKKAQKETWRREDSAQQRAVRDMRAAGLSPTLAAGHGAPTSAPTNPKAPEFKQERILNLMQMKANIAQTEAETRSKLVKAEVDESTKRILENVVNENYLNLQNQRILSGQRYATEGFKTGLTKAQRDEIIYNLARSQKLGVRTGDRHTAITGGLIAEQATGSFIGATLELLNKMRE